MGWTGTCSSSVKVSLSVSCTRYRRVEEGCGFSVDGVQKVLKETQEATGLPMSAAPQLSNAWGEGLRQQLFHVSPSVTPLGDWKHGNVLHPK